MRPAQAPSSVNGSISRCVVFLDRRRKNRSEFYGPMLTIVPVDVFLVDGDIRISFFIDIQVLHETLP